MRKVCCIGCWIVLGWMMLALGCGDYAALFLNQTASLGGGANAIPLGDAGTQGSPRGQIRAMFINNTPYRAVFSAGAYDQSSRHSGIDLVQFGNDQNDSHLEADASTGVGTFNCSRQLGIGNPDLIRLMGDMFNVTPIVDSAVVEGVEFFEVKDTGEIVDQGAGPARVVNIGIDFRCEDLLIFRFEVDDIGPAKFRVDFQVVPSESTRPQ